MDESPGTAVEDAVRRALDLVDTWLHWDGIPRLSEDGDRIYTPHKAVRRIADHLIDHLAEVEALLAGVDTQPDNWHASLLTLESDWARFTEADRDEAHQRLPRLARTSRCGLPRPDQASRTGLARATGPYGRSPTTSRVSSGTPSRSVT